MTLILRRVVLAAAAVFLISPVTLLAGSSYYAVCHDASHDGGWTGHVYRTRDRAQTEAEQHNGTYAGHHAYVMGN